MGLAVGYDLGSLLGDIVGLLLGLAVGDLLWIFLYAKCHIQINEMKFPAYTIIQESALLHTLTGLEVGRIVRWLEGAMGKAAGFLHGLIKGEVVGEVVGALLLTEGALERVLLG